MNWPSPPRLKTPHLYAKTAASDVKMSGHDLVHGLVDLPVGNRGGHDRGLRVAHDVNRLGDVEVGVSAGVLEGLAHAVVDCGGVAPHDVDVVGVNPLLGELGAQGGVGEAGLKVVLALDGGVDLLRGGEVGGVLVDGARELHAADEADGLVLGHEASDDTGEGAQLREVGKDGLDVVGVLVVAHLGLGVGVGDEEVDVGVALGGVGDDLGPRGGELVAVADDEVDVLVDVGLGGGGGVGVGGVLLGLEHLPISVLFAGALERLVVALVPAAVGDDAGHDHGDLVAGLLLAAIGGAGVGLAGVGGPAAAGECEGRSCRGQAAGGDELTTIEVELGHDAFPSSCGPRWARTPKS